MLLATLKAPSTYKLIEDTVGLPGKSGERNVFLTYDAANSYNAPIRATFWCVIASDGTASLGGGGEDKIADDLEMQADNAMVAAVNAIEKASPPAEEVPVCDRPDSAEKRALMNEIGVDCMGE